MPKEDRKNDAAKYKAKIPSLEKVRGDPTQRGMGVSVIRIVQFVREAYEMQNPGGKEAAQPGRKRPGSYSSATKFEGKWGLEVMTLLEF